MNIFYQFFSKDNLLIQKFVGVWSTEKYEAYLNVSTNIIEVNKIEKILTDLREAEINSDVDDIKNLIRIRHKISNNQFTNVQVVSSPMSTVAACLYQEELTNIGYKYHYCSTIGHAIKLLDLNISAVEMEKTLKELKFKY
jgi:hypothetical protein